MAKALTLNDNLKALLAKFSEGTDPSTVTFYEAVVLNTLPVSKKGTIFHGATMTQSYLQQMADYVEGGNGVPMHTLHYQSGQLPFGKIVKAQIFFSEEGLPELRVVFYMDNQHQDLIKGLETGAISELSIGAQPKHMLCSECGFDFLGADATFSNFWNMTCDKDHEIGKEGVHLNITGLDRWYELSLVSIGAAKGTKIVPDAKSLMGADAYNRLAASGVPPELTILQATLTPPAPKTTPPKDNSMDLAAATSQLVDTRVKLGLLEADKLNLTSQVTDLTTKLSATTTELATAKTELDSVKVKLSAAEGTDAVKEKARADASTKVLFTFASELAVAAGLPAPTETDDAPSLEKVIKDSRQKLAALPTGGVAQVSGTKQDPVSTGYAAASFNSR